MTQPEIEAFLAVVQYGSISAAADQIYITQPAITRRIQNLERELEYRLFQRGKGIRGSSLTERGRAFLPIAQRWNEVYREARALQAKSSKPVFRLASIGSASRLVLSDIFRRMTDECFLDFHLCHSVEGHTLIENGSADAVLIDYLKSSTYSTDTVLSIPVYAAPFVVVGGAEWKNVQSVQVSDLGPSDEIRLPWNTAFDTWHDHHFNPTVRPIARLDDAASVKYFLQHRLFAVMPKTEAIRLSGDNADIHMIDLREGPPDEIIHCLISPMGNNDPLVKHFLAIVRDCCESSPSVRCLLS